MPAAGDVAAWQETWLLDCLQRNCDTDYGRKYSFDAIRSTDDFRKQVPLIAYEDVEADIRNMADGEANVLFAGQPVAFERTSGSTRGSKLIPYSPHSLKDFQVALLPWLGDSIRQYAIRSGTGYFSISPATRQPETAAGGIPIGLPDGAYLGEDAVAAFMQVSAVPAWVGSLQDVAAWQLATLYWLVRRHDLALISVWSPTFMLTLLDALEQRSAELAGWLQSGTELSGQALPADLDAFARLEAFDADRDARLLWPDLKLVSCWADASSRPYFAALVERLPHAAFQGKGLLSTEGVVTIPDRDGLPVLAADSGFFEFELDDGELRLGHELGKGEQYEVVITTSGGLYRYRTGDRITCEGFAGSLPVLRFVGRKGLTCDMVGEKLDEGFVLSCLEDVPGFRMLVPVSAPKAGYALVVDEQYRHESGALVERVESRLYNNPHYAYARRIGQLEKLSLCEVSQPLDKYLQRLFSRDTRLGDLKVTALRAEPDWLETFAGTAT
jgi:hypothetical protein